MATVGKTTIGTTQKSSGPAPLVDERIMGPAVEGSFNTNYLAASGGEKITEFHVYCKTRDRTNRTCEAAIFTYDRQYNDEDFYGVPVDLFSDIESLSPAVTTSAGWKTITGLNIVCNNDDYCMCVGSPDAASMVWYGGNAWAVSFDNSGMSLSDTGTSWSHNNFDQLDPSAYFVYTPASSDTNMKINVGDSFKDISEIKINIGDTWKDVSEMKINIGDTWKTIF